jgi:hypothetical protein
MGENIDTVVASLSGAKGYASERYALALEEFGEVRELPSSGGWLLERQIPGTKLRDGMGCYPLFCCREWRGLRDDLQSLAERIVCIRIVTDPFTDVGVAQLREAFPDVCYVYKDHFVTDLSQPLERFVAGNHLRNVRRALSILDVRESTRNEDALANWQSLYDNLVDRHGITGIASFSAQSFERQLQVPGIAAFSAFDRGEVCGMTLWYVQEDVAYYHLGAYSKRGYALAASFALFWNAFKQFASQGVRWAALGAGAGTNALESGLTRFKRGWATGTRPVFFCGRILQPKPYAKLVAKSGVSANFFPAYRAA